MMHKPSQETDEAFVQSIRRGVKAMDVWRGPMAAVVALFLMLGAAAALLAAAYQVHALVLTNIPSSSAYIGGMIHGVTVGFLVSSTIHAVFQFRVVTHGWRLLIAYHDRLEQAGLLPLEPAATMDSRSLEQSRS